MFWVAQICGVTKSCEWLIVADTRSEVEEIAEMWSRHFEMVSRIWVAPVDLESWVRRQEGQLAWNLRAGHLVPVPKGWDHV